ncbi:MAG: nitrous oxide reductase accessory protein NosL [Flavobacteriales bacterium]|nr:nitrous oxide reductase accessory protein NosL [Flavobacteriales bacterium]
MRTSILSLLLSMALLSCGQSEARIDFGQAECAHCRMNVVDKQFGAALITLKGRQYVFDDISCMVKHVQAGTIAEGQVAAWYVCDHSAPGTLIDATTAFYLHGPSFRSPMRGDVAAFASEEKRGRAQVKDKDEAMDWRRVREFLKD